MSSPHVSRRRAQRPQPPSLRGAYSSHDNRLALPGSTWPQHIARWLLGGALIFAGTGHLTVGREEFLAQVPPWLPIDPDVVVVASGVVELALGLALIIAWGSWRAWVGWAAALFFVAIFPGNIAQFTEGRDGFGLDTDLARGIRLLFQPVLVVWALWSTGAWRAWREWRAARSATMDA